MTALGAVVIVCFLVSRVAYAGGVGWMLTLQRREQFFTRALGVEGGYRRFRRIAAMLMNVDGVAFVAVVLATMGTLGLAWPSRPVQIGVGTMLCVAGVGAKVWAASLLGDAGYHWKDFFGPHLEHELVREGPYRWFTNPMYTVGYLQTYGLALIFASWPGLVAAAFAQAAILTFYYFVERPHVARLAAGVVEPAARRPRLTEPRRSARG